MTRTNENLYTLAISVIQTLEDSIRTNDADILEGIKNDGLIALKPIFLTSAMFGMLDPITMTDVKQFFKDLEE